MRRIREFLERGGIFPASLLAGAMFAFLTAVGVFFMPIVMKPVADMRIEPAARTLIVGETFTVALMVESSVPVNVFGGEVQFNNSVLAVESIDYNTSIAELWAEKPWYENGAGTINFGGGTTHQGGFVGAGKLLSITFRTLDSGDGTLSLHDARILLHDGLGTDAQLKDPIDAIFTVESAGVTEHNVLRRSTGGTAVTVFEKKPSTDINGDGKQGIADISIFMIHMPTGDPTLDFNGDGYVNVKDLSILLNTK